MSVFNEIIEIKNKYGLCLFALIDPDKKNDSKLFDIINLINNSHFNAILIGGSNIDDNCFEQRVELIKKSTKLPTILFPGSSNQITKKISSMLYLNLISGRNPKYLIEEQVAGAMKIYSYQTETIPTAYILLDGGNITSVVETSNTNPLSMENKDLVLSHALAGQFLGNEIIYFDCGSGSRKTIKKELIKYIYSHISIPIMVGGGIRSYAEAKELNKNGASFVVIGNALENNSYIDK